MKVIRDIQALEEYSDCSFVPTMGALHEGHLALIRDAATVGGPVVVSVFVNPTQFGPGEDFERYPRRLDRDVERAAEAGADAVFAPKVDLMYPPHEAVSIPPLPQVATEPGLEDARRPGHFAGVAQVVARLFDLVRPRHVVFGEKDYQQLKVIEAIVDALPDRWPGLSIVPHPTVREPDGLAMSSRNQYLDPADRDRAGALFRALSAAAEKTAVSAAEQAMHAILEAAELAIDYAVARDARTLMPIEAYDQPARALIAARLGSVRLIDNAPLGMARNL